MSSSSHNGVRPAGTLGEYGVVYFGNDWSAENRTSSHHIARRLSQVVPVLYIETPGIRAPRSTARDFRKIWRKLSAALAPARRIHDKLSVQTIPQIPFRQLPFVNLLNRRLAEALARREMRRLGFRRCVSWFVTPHPGALAGRLGEELIVYYCIDDYAAYPGMDPVVIQSLDDALTRAADIVFVAPAALVEPKRALAAHVHPSPHGVDFDLFSRAGDPATPLAVPAAGLRHPVIGYFGNVGEWLDYPLLDFLARSRPGWTFLFVGFATPAADALRSLPNAVLAGPQPYEELPRWAAAFDAAIYPMQVNRQVKNSNPLKIREYLATGKPVVSVVTPETSRFSSVLSLASTREEFLGALDRAIAEDTPERRRARMDSVRGTSWDARFQETLDAVNRLLDEKRAR